jgi:hypothetical protein
LKIANLAPPPPPPEGNFAFQAILLNYVTNGAVTAVQTDSNEPGGHWLALEATGAGQSIQYAIPSLPAGNYDLQMYWKGNNDRGILSSRWMEPCWKPIWISIQAEKPTSSRTTAT